MEPKQSAQKAGCNQPQEASPPSDDSAEFRLWPALLVVAAGTSIYVLGGVQRMSPPVVAMEIMNELAVTPDQMGLMFAITIICYGLIQPVAGYWTDRFGPRRCLLASVVLLSLGSLVFSMSQGLAMGFLARMAIGFAAGLTLLPCIKLARQWLPPRQFRMATSGIIASAALANFIVGRPLVQLTSNYGWRGSFVILAVVGLLLGALVMLLVRDNPPTSPKLVLPEPVEEVKLTFFTSIYLIIRQPEFWLLGFLYCFIEMLYGVFTGLWAGPYLIEVYGQSEVAVGNMLSVSAFGFLFGPPLMVLWGNAWRSYGKVLFCITLVNIAVVLFLISAPAVNTSALYLLCFVAPVGAQAAGLIFVMVNDLFPKHLAASSMGLLNVIGIIPSATMQKVVGNILTQGAEMSTAPAAAELYAQAFKPLLIFVLLAIPLAAWQIRKERVGPIVR